jgi:SRSO17 transposase
MTRIDRAEQRHRQEIQGWHAGLDALHARIAHRFHRAEVRERAKRYLVGLLGRVERKNGWQLAEYLREAGPQGVQRLLNKARWNADEVRDDLRAYVIEHLGASEGVLIVDETSFPKEGTKSVGVKPQYCGRTGEIENCQVGVFLAYASSRGSSFLDRELFLPEDWVQDQGRRIEAGVPYSIDFAKKADLARAMLERAFAAGVPESWVTGDAQYGEDTELRRWLERQERSYVLAVKSSHPIWQDGQQVRADCLVSTVPAGDWALIRAGAGSEGNATYEWARVRLPYACADGMAHWLLLRRNPRSPTGLGCFRVYGPEETPLAEMVRVAKLRWSIEESFQDAKGTVGLDQYEVRKWDAWYRHITLALLAHAYLEVIRFHATAHEDDHTEKGDLQRTSSR